MNKLTSDKAQKFVAWLTMIKGFLPKSMTISEAQEIFERKCEEDNSIKMKKWKQRKISCAQREALLELLYKNDESEDDGSAFGETGTGMVSGVADDSSRLKKILP